MDDCEKVFHYLKSLQGNDANGQKFQLNAGAKEKLTTDTNGNTSGNFSDGLASDNLEFSVVVFIGKKRFTIERKLLELHSLYFKTHPDIHKNIPIRVHFKLNPIAWQLVHTWLTSQKGIVLDAKHVVNVYIVAKCLQIPKLMNQCLQFIVNYTGDVTNNVMPLVQEIQAAGDEELIQTAHKTLVKHGQNLLKSDQFLNYNVSQVCSLLCDDLLCVKSEKSVFDAAMSWLLYKWPERNSHVTQVIACVRFGLMTESELIVCVSSDGVRYYLGIPQCQEMILKAFQYLAAVDVGCEMLVPYLAPKQRKRVQLSDVDSVSVVSSEWSIDLKDCDVQFNENENSSCCVSRDDDDSSSSKVDRFDAQSSKMKTLIQKAHQAAGSSKTNKIQDVGVNKCLVTAAFRICDPSIVMFAHDANIAMDVVLCYDIRKDKWQELLLVNHRLKNYGSAILGNKIFITGGILRSKFNRPVVVNSAKYLDFNNSQWFEVNHLQTPRFDHALVVCNDKLFAIGGFGPREICLSSIECYYPNEDHWVEITCLPEARAGAAVVNCGQHLWVCGGVVRAKIKMRQDFVATDRVDCYDVLRNYWYAQCPLPLPLGYALGLVFHGNIYVIGGASTFLNVPQYTNSGLSNRMFMFDIVTEKWSELERSIRPRFKSAGVVVGNHFYVFGGCHSPQSAECFNCKKKKWLKISRCPQPVIGATCFFILFN